MNSRPLDFKISSSIRQAEQRGQICIFLIACCLLERFEQAQLGLNPLRRRFLLLGGIEVMTQASSQQTFGRHMGHICH